MTYKKIVIFPLFVLILLFSFLIGFYYQHDISNINNPLQRWVYTERFIHSNDTNALDKIMSGNYHDKSAFRLLDIMAKRNIYSDYTAAHLLYMGHFYDFTENEKDFLMTYFKTHKPEAFTSIYCTYFVNHSSNFLFMDYLFHTYYHNASADNCKEKFGIINFQSLN